MPVINRISAGYPRDFTDLAYPARVADDYVGCPDVRDKDAFGARVHGDSMTPKYQSLHTVKEVLDWAREGGVSYPNQSDWGGAACRGTRA